MSRKIFVGSLPNGIEESTLRSEFEKYGQVEEIFVKPGCEAGRQWSFVTFADTAQAQRAKELCDRILTFPGSERPCDVMLAKNQGMGGQASPAGAAGVQAGYVSTVAPHANSALNTEGPRKIFVGSLPDDITDAQLRAEFTSFGTVEDTYIKQGCEPGRQWAFVTFTNGQQALLAKTSTDNILIFPGAPKACEVTLARNQGMFGQDAVAPKAAGHLGVAPVISHSTAPRKIFVGSLPDNITDASLRDVFSQYGTIIDLHLKTGCEPGRQWAFITYQTPEQANHAKSNADRQVVIPGADRACEVMLARNQGKNGAESMNPGGDPRSAPAASTYMVYAQPQAQFAAPQYAAAGQPPPPTAPPPPHLTPWRTYYTAVGLPYYHNSTSGVTQWECPPDLQVPGAGLRQAIPGPPVMAAGYAAAPAGYYQAAPVGYRPY